MKKNICKRLNRFMLKKSQCHEGPFKVLALFSWLFQKLAFMNFLFFIHDKRRIREGGDKMGNPKKDSKHFRPSHLGTQPIAAGGNNGKKMQDKSGKHPQVIQTKGE